MLKTKIALRSRFTLALLLMVSVTSQGSLGLASSYSSEGNAVGATPYDRKINISGVMQNHRMSYIEKDPASLFRIARSFRYTRDAKGKDTWQTPEETEMRRAGDCEDKAVWLYAQLKANGHTSARLVIGKYKSFQKTYHVWVTYADAQGTTYILDPATQTRPWVLGNFSKGFYIPYYSYDGKKRYRHKTLGS